MARFSEECDVDADEGEQCDDGGRVGGAGGCFFGLDEKGGGGEWSDGEDGGEGYYFFQFHGFFRRCRRRRGGHGAGLVVSIRMGQEVGSDPQGGR